MFHGCFTECFRSVPWVFHWAHFVFSKYSVPWNCVCMRHFCATNNENTLNTISWRNKMSCSTISLSSFKSFWNTFNRHSTKNLKNIHYYLQSENMYPKACWACISKFCKEACLKLSTKTRQEQWRHWNIASIVNINVFTGWVAMILLSIATVKKFSGLILSFTISLTKKNLQIDFRKI